MDDEVWLLTSISDLLLPMQKDSNIKSVFTPPFTSAHHACLVDNSLGFYSRVILFPCSFHMFLCGCDLSYSAHPNIGSTFWWIPLDDQLVSEA